MSRRDRILLLLLALTAAAAFFYTTMTSSLDKMHESEKGIARYEAAVRKIDAESLQNSTPAGGGHDAVKIISITDAADLILSQLKKAGITPGRYQITGTGKNPQSVEFVYTCEPEEFVRFITSAEGSGTGSYTITDAAVKQERNGGVSVVMHAAAAPCRFATAYGAGAEHSYGLSRLFTARHIERPQADKAAAAPSAPVQGTAKFRIIGTVSGADGVQYLYVKNTENNKLYKLAPDKVRENSAARYVLVIDNAEYEILKK